METRVMNDRKYFTYLKEKDERTDAIAVKMLERNDIEGLLPFQYVRQEDEKYFRYEAGAGETLENWLGRVQHRKDVVKLLESLISVYGEVNAYLLEERHVCTDIPFIMVENGQCTAAYIPVEDGVQGDFIRLAQRIVFDVRFAVDEDFSYLFDLQNAFGRQDVQNIMDLKKWIRIANGERKREAAMDLDALEENRPVYAADRPGAENQQTDKGNMYGGIYKELGISNADGGKEVKKTAKKHGLFKKDKKGKTEKENAGAEPPASPGRQKELLPKKEIINNLNDGDSTIMTASGSFPVLVHSGSGKEYCITGESCVIGTGVQADIVVQDNPTVSRKHARIFYKNGSYYIEDTGSTNGTCVNGEMLRRMEPYKLSDKARIQFSDEDFIYKEMKQG